MNQQIRFFLAILAASVLHAIAAPMLLKIGWQCPARLAGEALAQEGISVSLVEIAHSEPIQIPEQNLPNQDSTNQIQQTAAEIPAEQIETLPDEEFTVIEETQSPLRETLEHQQPEILSLPAQNNETSHPNRDSSNAISQEKRAQKSLISAPKTNPLPSADAPRQIDTDPTLISNPRPPYPNKAREEGAEGIVYIKVKIDASGKISAATIARSSGREDLDQAAIKTVSEKWRFKPARAAGLPVPCEKTISIEFRLR